MNQVFIGFEGVTIGQFLQLNAALFPHRYSMNFSDGKVTSKMENEMKLLALQKIFFENFEMT
jgi:hypothetical protein